MNLPVEIIVHIFKYLDPNDLLRLKLVSKWYYEFITNNLMYINRQVYQMYLEKKVLQLLETGDLTPEYLSELIVNQKFELKSIAIMIYSLQNCSDSVNKLQLTNIKQMYSSVVSGNPIYYIPLATKVVFNKIGKLCASFLIKMKVKVEFLLGSGGCHLDLLEHILDKIITDISYSDRQELLEYYIQKQILNNDRNQINDLFNRTFLYQCLRRLTISQKNEKCLELMDIIVNSLNLEPEQQTILMNEILFYGVWKKKNKVIDFAMERGAQYDFNNNVITRLLL